MRLFKRHKRKKGDTLTFFFTSNVLVGSRDRHTCDGGLICWALTALYLLFLSKHSNYSKQMVCLERINNGKLWKLIWFNAFSVVFMYLINNVLPSHFITWQWHFTDIWFSFTTIIYLQIVHYRVGFLCSHMREIIINI